MNGVSIVVPIYNEKENIEKLVSALSAMMRELKNRGMKSEVVLVNDGSTDQSAETFEKSGEIESFSVVNHKINRGYGAALKTGINNAVYDIICLTDADGTYPTDRIPEMLDVFIGENHDMVVGARTAENVKIPFARKPAKWFLTRLAEYLCDQQIPDLNSGLRVFKKKLAKKFTPILQDGFSFTTTITLAMLINGYSVKYMPIEYYARTGNSKIRPIKDTLNFIQLIVRIILCFDPLRVFLPISLFLFAASFLSLLYRIWAGGGLLVITVMFFIAGTQVLTVGMLADLIDRRLLLQQKSCD